MRKAREPRSTTHCGQAWPESNAAPVELPQILDGRRVQFCFEQGSYRMRPNLMDHVLVLEIPCVRFVNGTAQREFVPVKVQ